MHYCQVCYQQIFDDQISYQCSCAHKICDFCYISWVDQEIQNNIQNSEIVVKCPNGSCTVRKDARDMANLILHEIPSKDPENNMIRMKKENIENNLLKYYVIHGDDMRKCPNRGCTYSGFILKKPCNGKIQCERCKYQWKDPSQYTTKEKLILKLKSYRQGDFKFLTTMHTFLFEEPCPKCGVMIQKSGGCSYMQCGKCKHEFCWNCAQPMPGHAHPRWAQNICYIKPIMMKFNMLLLVFLWNFKIISECETVKWFEYQIFITLIALAFVNLSVISFKYVEKKKLEEVRNYYRVRSRFDSIREKIIKSICFLLLGIFLLSYRFIIMFVIFSPDLIRRTIIVAIVEILTVFPVLLVRHLIWSYRRKRAQAEIKRYQQMRELEYTQYQDKSVIAKKVQNLNVIPLGYQRAELVQPPVNKDDVSDFEKQIEPKADIEMEKISVIVDQNDQLINDMQKAQEQLLSEKKRDEMLLMNPEVTQEILVDEEKGNSNNNYTYEDWINFKQNIEEIQFS